MSRTTLWFILFIIIFFVNARTGFSRSLEEIKSDKRLIVLVVDENTLPINYTDDKDTRTGIDIELAEQIAAYLNVKLELKFVKTFDEIIPAIETDDGVDIGISAITITEDRKKRINFSKSYCVTGITLMLSNMFKNCIRNFEDIEKYTSGCLPVSLEGETTEMYKELKKRFPYLQLVVRDTNDKAFSSFISGSTLGYCADRIFMLPLANQHSDKVYVLEDNLTYDYYGVGVNKKYEDLLGEVNALIEKIKNNGELENIIQRHIRYAPMQQKPEPKPKPKQQPIVKEHTVGKDEFLSTISEKYYGTPDFWEMICWANRGSIGQNCNNIRKGMILVIPIIPTEEEKSIHLISKLKQKLNDLIEFHEHSIKQEKSTKEQIDLLDQLLKEIETD